MGAETDGLVYTGAWTNSSVLVFTDEGNAQMACNFSGDAIAIMGATSVAYGNYTVAVDGNVQQMSASANMDRFFAHEEVCTTKPSIAIMIIDVHAVFARKPQYI